MNRSALVLCTITLMGVIHLATLRSGHEWGDDFSLYVAHARNLVEGRPYADTGYIYNPDNPVLSPRTYPPVFPLLLAPVYYVCGVNLTAMKVLVLLMLMALLGVLAMVYRKNLPLPYVLGCLILFALNPFVWQHKDRLLSEIPFMLFAYLALLLADKALTIEESRGRRIAWGALAGLCAYLAMGTRTVGVIIVPSIVACELLRRRRLGLVSGAAAAVFLVGVTAQRFLLPLDGSYADQFVFDPLLYLRVGFSLFKTMGYFVETESNRAWGLALYGCLLALAVWGCAARVRRGVTVYEFFALFNCLLLTLWPAAEYERRYLMPILPLFLLYVAEGLCQLHALSLNRVATVAAAALSLAVLLSYVATYRHLEAGPIQDGVSTPEAVALFDWIQSCTERDEIFLFQKPRALALYTRRQAIALHVPNDDEQMWQFLHRSRITHVVIRESPTSRGFTSSTRLLKPFVTRHGDNFDVVYANAGFSVYRLRESSLASR